MTTNKISTAFQFGLHIKPCVWLLLPRMSPGPCTATATQVFLETMATNSVAGSTNVFYRAKASR